MSDTENTIESLLEDFSQKGLIGQFHDLVMHFGKLLFSYIASDEQIRTVDGWHANGCHRYGGFLMADAGGPSIDSWKTIYKPSADVSTLQVSKVWIIEGHRLDYGCISAASNQKLYPISILVSPDRFSSLKKTPVGLPFLDGTLQLGNVSGEVEVSRSDMLTNGGLASTSTFLARVRPRFVRALMGHVQWLHSRGRLAMSDDQQTTSHCLNSIAETYCHRLGDHKPSLMTAMAIKFTANRLLLDLVTSGAVKGASDRRDLMAFTRMEGSSYRCLFEIYSKSKIR